jgi:hypothetical protein
MSNANRNGNGRRLILPASGATRSARERRSMPAFRVWERGLGETERGRAAGEAWGGG